MRIHADNLTSADIATAAHEAGAYAYEITAGGSRSRARRFDVYLTGSSRYAQNRQHAGGDFGNDKAATWDEWGSTIAALFDKDPTAIIGHYDGRNDFIDKTTEDADRISRYVKPDSYEARTHRAPWLEG